MNIFIYVLKDHSVIAGNCNGPIFFQLSFQFVKPVLSDTSQLFQIWHGIQQIESEPDLFNLGLRKFCGVIIFPQ